jgi:methylthioribose-1-phosphate isomerase
MTDLPFIFRRENVVRYEDGVVWILDRRVYPFETRFARCATYEDVALAIEQMVTQSGGPGYAAGYGMAQAARQAAGLCAEGIAGELEAAALRLINTRPTNNHIRVMVKRMLHAGKDALAKGESAEQALLALMEEAFAERHQSGMALGTAGASLIADGDAILNHCWAESGIVYTLRAALQQGKRLTAYCSETRPYLQGARLTADAIADMGIPTTVVTDNMPAHLMSKGMISTFFAGADRVTMDGHVVNKIGTLQLAICTHHYGIPFYAFCFGPDRQAPTPASVIIEERDPDEVLHCLGRRTATLKAHGYYPAFDVTPPELVTGLVTNRGVFAPGAVEDYFL